MLFPRIVPGLFTDQAVSEVLLASVLRLLSVGFWLGGVAMFLILVIRIRPRGDFVQLRGREEPAADPPATEFDVGLELLDAGRGDDPVRVRENLLVALEKEHQIMNRTAMSGGLFISGACSLVLALVGGVVLSSAVLLNSVVRSMRWLAEVIALVSRNNVS